MPAPRTTHRSLRSFGPRRGLAALAGATVLLASGAAPAIDPDSAPAHGRVQSAESPFVADFDAVHRIVKARHWDPDRVSAAWDEAHAARRPRAAAATTPDDARAVIADLLATLGQSHFAVIPAEAADRFDDARGPDVAPEDLAAAHGYHGLELRVTPMDGTVFVARVDTGSPGERAGIRPGWIVTRIGERDAADIVDVAREYAALETPESLAAVLAMARLNGAPGTTLELGLDAGDAAEHTVDLALVASPIPMAGLGELPPMPVAIERRTLDQGIGYFRLGAFFGPDRVLPAWRRFLDDHRAAPGIVLDLRGNPGGVILMSTGMLGFVIDEAGHRVGTLQMRDPERGAFSMPLMINPRPDVHGTPMAVLVDELSASNSEILAAALQDLGRATIVGTRTRGMVLPSMVERLPSGDGLLHAFAGYERSSGGALEGSGVTPEISVAWSPVALREGRDPALDAAVAAVLAPAETSTSDASTATP